MKKITLFIAAAALFIAADVSAQMTMVRDGKVKSRIIVTTDQKPDSVAAVLLQDFVQRISGAVLPVVPADEVGKFQIGRAHV